MFKLHFLGNEISNKNNFIPSPRLIFANYRQSSTNYIQYTYISSYITFYYSINMHKDSHLHNRL